MSWESRISCLLIQFTPQKQQNIDKTRKSTITASYDFKSLNIHTRDIEGWKGHRYFIEQTTAYNFNNAIPNLLTVKNSTEKRD